MLLSFTTVALGLLGLAPLARAQGDCSIQCSDFKEYMNNCAFLQNLDLTNDYNPFTAGMNSAVFSCIKNVGGCQWAARCISTACDNTRPSILLPHDIEAGDLIVYMCLIDTHVGTTAALQWAQTCIQAGSAEACPVPDTSLTGLTSNSGSGGASSALPISSVAVSAAVSVAPSSSGVKVSSAAVASTLNPNPSSAASGVSSAAMTTSKATPIPSSSAAASSSAAVATSSKSATDRTKPLPRWAEWSVLIAVGMAAGALVLMF